MRTVYESVKLKQVVKGTCLKCGKKRQVTIVSEQTINPYNINKKSGEPKSRREVWNSCSEELKKLVERYKKKFICRTCYNELPWPRKWFDQTEKEYCETH